MSNTLFKKVTASAAALSIVLSVVAPVVGVKAADATVDAANRLASLGVIVDNSTDPSKYNLGSNITRREMLKVMMNLSSVEVTETCTGKFSDLPASDWGCKYAEAALNAGFIAANAKFRPNDFVTEAEALKMVMQARGVAAAQGVEPWGESYRQAAVTAGILSAETTVSSTSAAKRSMVFVSADSAVEVTTGTSSEEDDTEIDLGDLFGDLFGEDGQDLETNSGSTSETNSGSTSTDNGSTVVVTGGNVEVSLNPSSATSGTQIPNKGTVRFAKVDLTAGDKDVSINTIELSSVGLASVPTSTRVWFEKDGRRLSGRAAFSSDRTAVVSFAPAYVVKAGSTEALDLYVELDTVAGNDFQFSGKITSSSAASNNGSFTTAALRTASYTVAPVDFSVQWAPSTYNQSEDYVELGRFRVQNNDTSSETRDVNFQSITLRQNGNGDLTDLSELYVERNGVKVSKEASISSKDVTFVLNDTVKDGASGIYYIKAKVLNVQNNNGDTYQFSLRNDQDLSAVEVLNGYRSTVTRTSSDLHAYSINGSDLKFERDTSVELSKNYAKGTNDVILLQGTITTKTPITLEDLTLPFNSNVAVNQLFDTVYLQIGASTMTWSASSATGTTGNAVFLGLATVSNSAQVKIYGKLRDNAPAANFRFEDLRLTSFATAEYVSNQNKVSSAVGTISAVQVFVDSTGLSITRVDGLGNTNIAVGSKSVLVNGLNLAVTQGNDVSISNAEYSLAGSSGSYNNNAFATLYVDGTPVSTKTINGTTVKFDNLSKVVGKTAVKLELRVDFSDAYASGKFVAKLSNLDIVDTLTSQTISSISVPNSAEFTVADAKGILSVSDNNPKASLFLAGDKDQRVLAFRIKAENDSIKLRDLVFSGANLGNLSNFRILTPTNKYLAATLSTASSVEFTNLNPEDSIAQDRTETFYLVADVNTNVNETFNVTLNKASVNVRGSNGTIKAIDASSVNVASNQHLVAENKAVIAKSSNSSKNLTTSALRFTVTASGKDSVVLSGATFSNLFSGYTTGSGKIVVYKDSISSNNKLGETAVGTTTGDVTFTAQNTVDAGSTNAYIVVLEGVVAQSGANTLDWQVSLSNLNIVSGNATISANQYNNMGEFPLTETR